MTSAKYYISNFIRNSLIIPVFFVGHIFYEIGVGYLLFKVAGGIKEYPNGHWTTADGITWAFEIPLYVPGSYMMAKHNIGPCMWKGGQWEALLFLVATTITAIATGQLIQKTVNREMDMCGKYYWRLVVTCLGWIFIPVPVEMTLIYNFMVLC